MVMDVTKKNFPLAPMCVAWLRHSLLLFATGLPVKLLAPRPLARRRIGQELELLHLRPVQVADCGQCLCL